MVKPEYKYSAETEIIIGCSIKVHNALGPGFPEYIYQRALHIELKKTDLYVEREKQHPVFYDQQLIGNRRVDFLINRLITVELKAVAFLDDIHLNKALNYLEAFGLEIGLLINFGSPKLQFKRLINNKVKDKQ